MPEEEALRRKWDERHGLAASPPRVAEVLLLNRHLLPVRGEALDLACGRGANALLLAAAGLQVSAWDLSPVAIELLRGQARGEGLENLHGEVRDVVARPPSPQSFDIVCVSHFLHRPLLPDLLAALKPGGLLFYQTFTGPRIDGRGPADPTYRLQDNELLELTRGLKLRFYREERDLGDPRGSRRDQAMLVAQRPTP